MISIYTLEEGVIYIVNKPFIDYYQNSFSTGDKLTYVERNFSPYQGGNTIIFKERCIYLQEYENEEIIASFDEYLGLYDQSGRVVSPVSLPPKKRSKRWEAFRYFWLFLVFVAVSAWAVFSKDRKSWAIVIAGWFGIIFFGLGAVMCAKTMLTRKNHKG